MTLKFTIEDCTSQQAQELLGFQDKNLKILAKLFSAKIVFRSEEFILECENEEIAEQLKQCILSLYDLVCANYKINERDAIYAANQIKKGKNANLVALYDSVVSKTATGRMIFPKTFGQKEFADAMKKKDIVFAQGPAGTGKTYLAVVYAVECLKRGDVKRIILTRPAVEAGESLGFLPGDLKEKVDPYLRPLYDALNDMLSNETVEKYIEKGVIEIAPLAYMRGRTLDDSFIILDEAQNTTSMQMKMFLTRLGFHSKMVITGDITQIDLGNGKKSGLIESLQLLKGIDEIAMIELQHDDVVRNPLVSKIIERYAIQK